MSERASARAADGARAPGLVRMMILSALGAALTAAGARITIPWWPVPATAQVFFVLLCGAALGPRWGAAAQGQYIAAGALGLPVFAGGRGGGAVLLGPTGGYIVGFIVAAYVTGWLIQRRGELLARGGHRYLAAIAGAMTVWLCGWAWLAVWAAAGGETAPLRQAFTWGVTPFVALDLLKAVAAAAAGGVAVRLRGV